MPLQGAQRFLLLSMPALGAAGLFEVLKRHLMAQASSFRVRACHLLGGGGPLEWLAGQCQRNRCLAAGVPRA